MKRYAIIFLFLGALLLFSGGCTSSDIIDQPFVNDQSFALAELGGLDTTSHEWSAIEFGPAIQPSTPANQTHFHLGAGDALGQAVFMNYAALVCANPNWHFANATITEELY